MLKKIITAALAAMLLAAVAVPAFAAPKDKGKEKDKSKENPFTIQYKALNKEITALQHQLNRERALDQALYGKIKRVRNMVQVDPAKVAAYQAEIAPLKTQLDSLKKQLCDAKKAEDTAKIEALKASIKDTHAQIAAVNAKYPDLAKALRHKHKTFCNVQILKTQLEPKYESLKALVAKAAAINVDIRNLTKDFKAAVKAGDTTKAQSLLDQLTAKKQELKDNLAARVALRAEITQLLKDCVVKIS